MNAYEKGLINFAKLALNVLEDHHDWSADTIDEIGCAAVRLGVAETDEHGMFVRTNKLLAISPMGFDDSDPIERAMRRARA